MTNVDDALGNLEAQAGINGADESSDLEVAIAALPPEKGVRVSQIAHKYHIDPNDPASLLIRVAIDVEGMIDKASELARISNGAAQTLQDGIGKIPDTIYGGAIKAGEEIRGQLAQQMAATTVESGKAIVGAIRQTSQQEIAKIQEAASSFEKTFSKAVDQKTQSGVDIFAKAAADAALAAARAAAASRFFWSLWGILTLILFCAILGGFGVWGYLDLTHRITPAPIQINQGKLECGTAPPSNKKVCILQ